MIPRGMQIALGDARSTSMQLATRRTALAATGVLIAAVGIWVRLSRHRIDPDHELDLLKLTEGARRGLKVTDTTRLDVRAFYDQRDDDPAWITDAGVSSHAASALSVLDQAVEHGLNRTDYDADSLRIEFEALNHASAPDTNRLMQFEARLTTALLSIGHDVAVGRTSPASLDARWTSQRTPPDVPGTLASHLNNRLDVWLAAIEPHHAEYAALKSLLADPDRLAATRRDDAAEIVAANMERWRWMPDDLGARHIFVNIPSYSLQVREDGNDVLNMRVVVGKAVTNQTPILSSRVTSVVFNPSWNIPSSIVKAETVPAFLRDPSYLSRKNIDAMRATPDGLAPVDLASLKGRSVAELQRLLYRQRPGPGNALGLVMFRFNNAYDVYLHDTPPDGAFTKSIRALSHGCVRVEQPALLADYVLRDANGWTPDRVRRALKGPAEQYVAPGASIQVHLVYFTVIVATDGSVTFLPDVYRYDRKATPPRVNNRTL